MLLLIKFYVKELLCDSKGMVEHSYITSTAKMHELTRLRFGISNTVEAGMHEKQKV